MGSSGGGGGSGEISYPPYLMDAHGLLLSHNVPDIPSLSLIDVMNSMINNSPYSGENAYDPDIPIAAMITELGSYDTMVNLLSSGTGLDVLVAGILSDVYIDNAVTEFSNDLTDRLNMEILPRFEGGMRDINAVTSSAFAIGKANIESTNAKIVAKYSADLHLKAKGDLALSLVGLKLENQKMLVHYTAELNRIKIVAKKEQKEEDLKIDEADALWNINLWQHAGNFIAAPGGGTAMPNTPKKNQLGSALGGALSGAAAGAMAGSVLPGVGTLAGGIIGAVVGGAAGYFS